MKFYCPGLIATSENEYFEREEYVDFPSWPTSEFPTLQVILCVDENHNVLHMEEVCKNEDVPVRIFERARELNRQAGNVREFTSWNEVAIDLRHFFRRLAALAVPYNAQGKIIPGSTSIVRMISIYQSWPFHVKEAISNMDELYQKYWEARGSQQDDQDREKEPFIFRGTKYLEHLYRVLVPGHTREIYASGHEIEDECRWWSTRELVWEKLGLSDYITPAVSESEFNRELIRDAMRYRELQKAKA